MKKFIIKLIVFTAVLLLLDRIGAYFLQQFRPIDYKLFLESKSDFFEEVDSTDILPIGDSHIADAIDPRIIEKRMQFTAFNLGIYHSSPFENYYITKEALESLEQKPKIIVLGTNPSMFQKSLSKGRYTPLIIPFSFEFIRNSQEGFDGAFFLKTIQEKYLVNSLLNTLSGKSYTPTREIEDVYNGHSKFFNQIPETKWANFNIGNEETKIKEKQVEYFVKTIELAIKHNISVVIVHPPIWSEYMKVISTTESFKNFRGIINEITEKYELNVYNNYSDNPKLKSSSKFSKQDFLNTQHLNYFGSKKFSKGFADFLKKVEILKIKKEGNMRQL